MGKFVDEKLEKLGAERVFKLGEGDDDAKYVVRPHPFTNYMSCSIEEDFVTWKEALWPAVAQFFNIDSSQATQVGREYELTLYNDLAEEKIFTGEPHRLGSLQNQKP